MSNGGAASLCRVRMKYVEQQAQGDRDVGIFA